jgi:hypothetical protein
MLIRAVVSGVGLIRNEFKYFGDRAFEILAEGTKDV